MKRLLIAIIIAALILFASCSQEITKKTVQIIIPEHPWVSYANAEIWYSLKWTDGDGEHVKYIESGTSEVKITVNASSTIYICAYPLSDMLPFGTAFSPSSVPSSVVLSQDEGFLADVLMNLKKEVRSQINWEKLLQSCKEKTSSLREIDVQMLVSAAMNGNIGQSAIVKNKAFEIGPFTVQNGVWVSELEGQGRVVVTDGEMEKMTVVPGVYRFYEKEANLEMRIVCETDGKSACVFKPYLAGE
ncbi:MAG: hypothetical protein K6F82_00190 [Sphaerochaetaceae bacterium]|nr:hypothetical protein [Sphaerochaetaceae bacterium]